MVVVPNFRTNNCVIWDLLHIVYTSSDSSLTKLLKDYFTLHYAFKSHLYIDKLQWMTWLSLQHLDNSSQWWNYPWFSLGDAEFLPGELFFEQSRIDKRNWLQWKAGTGLHACSNASHECIRVCVVDNVCLAVVDCHVLTAVKQKATATPADSWPRIGATSHLGMQQQTTCNGMTT